MSVAAEFDALCAEISECRLCRLCETRTKVVVGRGTPDTDVMFVGEGPGRDEDLSGLPFVGRAGQLMSKMLLAAGIDEQRVYITNIVKCRPPENRDPAPDEQDACIRHLRRQTLLIRPRIIVAVGRIAASRLIRKDFKITKEHGQLFDIGGFTFMGVYHPAALLRNPAQKPEAYEDFLRLAEMMSKTEGAKS